MSPFIATKQSVAAAEATAFTQSADSCNRQSFKLMDKGGDHCLNKSTETQVKGRGINQAEGKQKSFAEICICINYLLFTLLHRVFQQLSASTLQLYLL